MDGSTVRVVCAVLAVLLELPLRMKNIAYLDLKRSDAL